MIGEGFVKKTWEPEENLVDNDHLKAFLKKKSPALKKRASAKRVKKRKATPPIPDCAGNPSKRSKNDEILLRRRSRRSNRKAPARYREN